MLGKKNESKAQKVLDVDASLQGNLVFKDEVNLHINGHFEGRLETKGDLLIGEHAIVKANIVGERITISGNVNGDVTAASELVLKSTGKLVGDIRTPQFITERGAVFHGMSRMLSGHETDGVPHSVFFNLDEVSRYLSVETSMISQWAENGKLPGMREGDAWKFDKRKVDEWIANGRII
jgi:excisionase family DNA binding protein